MSCTQNSQELKTWLFYGAAAIATAVILYWIFGRSDNDDSDSDSDDDSVFADAVAVANRLNKTAIFGRSDNQNIPPPSSATGTTVVGLPSPSPQPPLLLPCASSQLR